MTVSRAISFGLQAMKKHALEPPPTTASFVHGTKCERLMWRAWREYIYRVYPTYRVRTHGCTPIAGGARAAASWNAGGLG